MKVFFDNAVKVTLVIGFGYVVGLVIYCVNSYIVQIGAN